MACHEDSPYVDDSSPSNRTRTPNPRTPEPQIRFGLKEGVGTWVGKSPWKIEWGGGASIESPHYQRVHYCELLVRDFLMRLRCKRFPPIEKDMKMVLTHCGSLFLDPAVLTEVGAP